MGAEGVVVVVGDGGEAGRGSQPLAAIVSKSSANVCSSFMCVPSVAVVLIGICRPGFTGRFFGSSHGLCVCNDGRAIAMPARPDRRRVGRRRRRVAATDLTHGCWERRLLRACDEHRHT
jgi:hypothetical protein